MVAHVADNRRLLRELGRVIFRILLPRYRSLLRSSGVPQRGIVEDRGIMSRSLCESRRIDQLGFSKNARADTWL